MTVEKLLNSIREGCQHLLICEPSSEDDIIRILDQCDDAIWAEVSLVLHAGDDRVLSSDRIDG